MAWSSSGTSVLADGAVRWTWNPANLFTVGWDLNPLAMQIGAGAGGVRDSLSDARDHLFQPLANQYRTQVYPASGYGGHAPEDDYSLYNNADFQNWVLTGQVPIPQAAIDTYQADLIRQTAAAKPAGIPLNNFGEIDNTDANVISWLQAHGVPTLPSGSSITPNAPILGSDIFNGTVNLPGAASGPTTSSPSSLALARAISPQTGPAYGYGAETGMLGAGSGGSSNMLVLLAAAAAAYYLLTKKGN
jgi:hypothetical protein